MKNDEKENSNLASDKNKNNKNKKEEPDDQDLIDEIKKVENPVLNKLNQNYYF